MSWIAWLVLGIGVVVVGGIWWRLGRVGREVTRALNGGETAAVLAAIGRLRESAQPSAYNFAIRRFWDRYQRDRAIPLIRELARTFPTAHIAQYWLDQVLKVEPALAQSELGKEFVDTYYQPAIASQCGQVG